MSFRFHPEAHAELIAAARYYDVQRKGSGVRFLSSVYHLVAQLVDHPRRLHADGRGFRRVTVRRYPYWLIYELESDCINIIAVSHHRREPAYWAGRTH